jgi:hypothetical protein
VRSYALGVGSVCFLGLGVTLAFAVPAITTGCTTHQCDSDFVNIDQSTGVNVGQVELLGPGPEPGTQNALWESSPLNGTWIQFPGQREYFFGLPPGFVPTDLPTAYVATDPAPNDTDAGDVTSTCGGETITNSGAGTYVTATGQLAQFGPFVNGGFLVSNGGCACYFLYISIPGTFTPPAAPPSDDAGTDGGSGDG